MNKPQDPYAPPKEALEPFPPIEWISDTGFKKLDKVLVNVVFIGICIIAFWFIKALFVTIF